MNATRFDTLCRLAAGPRRRLLRATLGMLLGVAAPHVSYISSFPSLAKSKAKGKNKKRRPKKKKCPKGCCDPVRAQAGAEARCPRCGPGNCSGCCDYHNRCHEGTSPTLCGVGGRRCSNCQIQTLVCLNQSCQRRCNELGHDTSTGTIPPCGSTCCNLQEQECIFDERLGQRRCCPHESVCRTLAELTYSPSDMPICDENNLCQAAP